MDAASNPPKKDGVESDAAPPLLGGSEESSLITTKNDGVVPDTSPHRLSSRVESAPTQRLLRSIVVSEPATSAQVGRVASVAVAPLRMASSSAALSELPKKPRASKEDYRGFSDIVAYRDIPPFSVSRVDFAAPSRSGRTSDIAFYFRRSYPGR